MRKLEFDQNRLLGCLKTMRGKRVLVVGDVGVDRYTIGSVERISPEAPVPIVLVEEEKLKLGLAANVADNIQSLGAEPLLLGVVGDDRGAQDFRKLLRDSGIRPSYLVVDPTRRTVLKERVVSERQQLLRVDYEDPNPIQRKVEEDLLGRYRELLPKADIVILEDYAKGSMSKKVCREIISATKKAGKMVAVDPNSKTPISHYEGATVLTPSTKEAESLSRMKIRDLPSLRRAGKQILESSRADHIVITRGKDGMAIFSAGTQDVHLIPTYAREVYDVSGAGDTVISVLALALASGATLQDAVVLGNLAAGVEVGKRGTATVSPEEIKVALGEIFN